MNRRRTYSRARIAAVAAISFTLGTLPAIWTGEWARALAGTAVLVIALAAAWISYRLGYANAMADRAFYDELDPRGERFRIQYRDRDEPTDTDTTGETR